MFFDTHAHIDYPEFNQDRAAVIERARGAGITKIICIGTDLDSSARAVELSRQFSSVYAAVGWHPSDAMRAPDDLRGPLGRLAKQPKVVAIGEIGLDYYRLPSKTGQGSTADDAHVKLKQDALFRQQMELAADVGLNCVVHQRDSFEDTLAVVQEFAGRVRTVFHCFSGTAVDMGRVLAAGGLVSFTGIVTFKNAQAVRETVSATPSSQFMLETDSPFLAPMPYRGKRCEPAYVREIATVVAEIKKISPEALSESTCMAAQRFFHGLAT